MGKETKKILGFIAFGVALYAVLMNFGAVIGALKDLWGLIIPVIAGLIIAFVINVPMKAFEKLYAKIFNRRGKLARYPRFCTCPSAEDMAESSIAPSTV